MIKMFLQCGAIVTGSFVGLILLVFGCVRLAEWGERAIGEFWPGVVFLVFIFVVSGVIGAVSDRITNP